MTHELRQQCERLRELMPNTGSEAWKVSEDPRDVFVFAADSDSWRIMCSMVFNNDQSMKRAEFIALTHNIIGPLLDEVERPRCDFDGHGHADFISRIRGLVADRDAARATIDAQAVELGRLRSATAAQSRHDYGPAELSASARLANYLALDAQLGERKFREDAK